MKDNTVWNTVIPEEFLLSTWIEKSVKNKTSEAFDIHSQDDIPSITAAAEVYDKMILDTSDAAAQNTDDTLLVMYTIIMTTE